MEQKDYKMEIMNVLAGKENHGRELAKLVGTNHMTALRKLSELVKMNIVDYREEGRNKVYFIKKSNEARSYLFILENYKLIKLLEKYPLLRSIVKKIQENREIEIAVIFGSYAKGISDEGSDIDIFIETSDKNVKVILERINSRVSVKIGRFSDKGLLFKEIEKNHVILKGVEKYYERTNIFEET